MSLETKFILSRKARLSNNSMSIDYAKMYGSMNTYIAEEFSICTHDSPFVVSRSARSDPRCSRVTYGCFCNKQMAYMVLG